MSFSEFQKNPNRLTSQDVRFLILAAFAILFALVALVALSVFLATASPSGGEFWLLRESGRSFLFERIEPYSGYVPAVVQDQVYGRSFQAGEEPYILDIPFHLLILYFPLAISPDPFVTRAVWMGFLLVSLIFFTFFSFRLTEWRPFWGFQVLFFLFSIFSYYTYTAIAEGASVILLGLAYASILLSLRNGMDELAGALIAFSALQWEVGGLFIIFIAWWVVSNRRWGVLAGFGMLAFILLVISFLAYPGWIFPYLQATWNNLKIAFGFSAHAIMGQAWPGFGRQFHWVIVAMLLIFLGAEWNTARRADFRRMYWTACLSLAVMPLLGMRSEMENLLVLLIPFALIFAVIYQRWKRIGFIISPILLMAILGIPWFINTRGAPPFGSLTQSFLFMFYPTLAVIGLYWVRWWAIRPPRTWLDDAR